MSHFLFAQDRRKGITKWEEMRVNSNTFNPF